MKTLLISTLSLFLLFSSTAQHEIGHMTKTFVDASRSNRNIQTEIYYPAVTAGNNTVAASGEYPVIVFGHGFVMAWDAYANLWEEFVPRGYIMVFPRTEGNLTSTNHQQFGWDLQYLVTEIQNEGNLPSSYIYNAIAPATALMGHSMGGGAAFLAADSLCTNGNTNLKTLIGLAPAESSTNGVSSIASASSVTVPSLILSGIQDGVTPPVDHHIPMYNGLASTCKTILNIIGGGHCYFANSSFTCDFGEGTSSTGIAITRTEQHQVTFDFVNLWLDYTLKNECNAFSVFQDSVATSSRITYNQVCSTVIPTIDATITQTSTQISSNENGATAYQWLDCGNNYAPIANETNQTFSPSLNGSYAVEVTVNGCKETSNCVSFTSSLGIDDIDNINFSIYPNPATDNFTINSDLKDSYSFNITNLNGKIVHTETNMINDKVISVNNLEKGSYFIVIYSDNQKIIKRFIKQ